MTSTDQRSFEQDTVSQNPLPLEGCSRWTGRISITIALTTAIGLLVLITVGSVLGVGVWLAQKNTFALLSDNANQGINSVADRLRQHLRPAQYQAKYIAERIAKGDIDPTDQTALRNMLSGALAAAPQINAVIFVDTDLQALSVGRVGTDIFSDIVDYTGDETARSRINHLLTSAYWGEPVWREEFNDTYLNLTYPVYLKGNYLGAIVAAVSVSGLSEFTSTENRTEQDNQFVLYGRDHVLAHAVLTKQRPQLTVDSPLPPLAGFGDAVLSSIWRPDNREPLVLELERGSGGHVLEVQGEKYIFIYKELHDFGSKPFIVGNYSRLRDVSEEVFRMFFALAVGIIMLVIALVAAVIVGRNIARPIVRFSRAAGQIRDLDISHVERPDGSIFRELNDQATAFNAMLRALQWFELYVPKKIVEQLIKNGDVSSTLSDARDVSVMFTDVAGFSSLSESLSAPEIATFVNEHFALVADCINAENGTVDKFIGDSVMAFWGAPEELDNTAEPACRAALAIAEAVQADNKKRVAAGKPPIRMRIGIHTGSVTVGNIGAQGRINYTIIGDTVNIGQRLEQLGKKLNTPGADVSILISGETASALSSDFHCETAGSHQLSGRESETEVFRLR